MPDVREVGQVSDIDGLRIRFYAEHGRVRLEVGRGVALLDAEGCEEFARLFVAACLLVEGHGDPTW